MTWPNLYIIGAPKCGTTALYDALRQVPGIHGPDRKEPWYWTQGLDDEIPFRQGQPDRRSPILSETDYRALYADGAEDRYRMDATPHVMYMPTAMERIRNAVPDAKAIVLLRDPVARAHSDYLMKMRGPQRGLMVRQYGEDGFLDALKAEEEDPKRYHAFTWKGRYAGHVGHARSVFGDDVRVLLSADLSRDPKAVVADLLDWLGLDREAAQAVEVGRSNAFSAPRSRLAGRLLEWRFLHRAANAVLPAPLRSWIGGSLLQNGRAPKPALSKEERRFLVARFEDDVVRLEALLGRPLPELRRSWDQDRAE